MIATKKTTEILSEMIDLILEKRCPICGTAQSVDGCVFGPGVMFCKQTLRENSSSLEQKEKIVEALKLLLSAQR